MTTNKKKIINDPVYGFITIPDELHFDIIEHPYFQRLRRIKQLGLTHLVYPGALHTRFHHAIGAMHLMQQAINTLRNKGHLISDEEATGVSLGILLHDIGHGPFSHALEHSVVDGMTHEEMTLHFMHHLNGVFEGNLSMAIDIFRDLHARKFLHQLIAGQLDMDRIDYLRRDSFYTGVSEGVINSDRIISMLNLEGDHLVMDEKGIYSIEKFIVARRLMYWQVYLHKTVISAEQMLIHALLRARELSRQGRALFATPALATFINKHYTESDFSENPFLIDCFANLDDFDIMACIKVWKSDDDPVLSDLSQRIINRHLFHTELSDMPADAGRIAELGEVLMKRLGISPEHLSYYLYTGEITNSAYDTEADKILLKYRNGQVKDIVVASGHMNDVVITRLQKKFYLCHPKLG